MKRVAVLFARSDSIYKSMPECDVFDIDRDARTFRGGMAVVAHPPCNASTRVLETRASGDGIRRTRECRKRHRMRTMETAESVSAVAGSRDYSPLSVDFGWRPDEIDLVVDRMLAEQRRRDADGVDIDAVHRRRA